MISNGRSYLYDIIHTITFNIKSTRVHVNLLKKEINKKLLKYFSKDIFFQLVIKSQKFFYVLIKIDIIMYAKKEYFILLITDYLRSFSRLSKRSVKTFRPQLMLSFMLDERTSFLKSFSVVRLPLRGGDSPRSCVYAQDPVYFM